MTRVDPDARADLWHPRKLELQMARFAADSSPGLVQSGVETFGASHIRRLFQRTLAR
jgi:hypothetical protein